MRQPKEDQLHIRIASKKKQELQELAGQTGQTLTDLIMCRLDNLPVRDYTHEKEIFLHLSALTKEIGYIGHNINQVTTAIHQINNAQKMEQGEFAEIQELLKQYLESRNRLSKQLEKAFFK